MNPLLPRALFGIAMAGLAVLAAWKAAQPERRDRDDPRYRPRARPGSAWAKTAARARDWAAGAAGVDASPPLDARATVDRRTLAQLRDALTGAPLDPSAELFRCADCRSFYSVASVRALANDNGARCIACGSRHRIAVDVVNPS